MTPHRLAAWQHAAVIGAFLGLVALFTYPLILAPGELLPNHKDPFMYGWTMVSNVRRLLSVPLAVFHGNTFYPNGNSVAYTDLLLTPTLTAGPIYLLTGNPVLQYNLTLLIWWALSGWAMYVMSLELLRSHLGATIAALAFTLCPFRTDFFFEFQMQLAFPVPLAVLFLARFLETARWRDLVGAVGCLWVEALASMYYAIILGMCLVVIAALHTILRPGNWSWRTLRRLVSGGALLGIALAPFLVPYFQNFRELGMERTLRQPPRHSADILTYFETGVTKLYHFRPTGHVAETSLFMGFVALALAVTAWVLRETPIPEGRRQGDLAPRLLTLGIAGAALGLVAALLWSGALRSAGIPGPGPQPFFDAILLLSLARIGLEGWRAARAGTRRGPIGEWELRWILFFLIALFFDLSLGPMIRFGRQELGHGLYYHLYPYLLPLHAMRITSRMGVVVVLGVSLLAGLGMKSVAARLPGARARAAVTGILALLLLAEYAVFPLPYREVDWRRPPPVYQALKSDPDDVAVLEWPLGWEYWDDYYTFVSLHHWKRLVNGASGFSPRMTQRISFALSRPDTASSGFPSTTVRDLLLGIHPLRYLIVHNALLDVGEQRKWAKLKEASWAGYVGRFGDDDLYRLAGEQAGVQVDKRFSWDYARTRKEVAFQVRPIGPPAPHRWVEVDLNGRGLGRQELGDRPTAVVMALSQPLYHSAPNTVTIRWRYRGSDGRDGRLIGRTGVVLDADLHVVSAGFESGNRVSVLVNGIEYGRDRRGYHVVAIHPRTGDVLWGDVFDTFITPGESRRLAAAIGRVPRGTVVVAAVKDEASGALTDEAVAALRSIGGTEDIRGHFRISHLLVGVKGAPPGTALERSGYMLLGATVGTAPERIGMEIQGFMLR